MSYNEPKTFGERAKRKTWAAVLGILAIFVTGIANHYLGIYAWIMGSVAVMDRWLGVTVTKDFYMTLGLLALTALIIVRLSRAGGRQQVYRDWSKKKKAKR